MDRKQYELTRFGIEIKKRMLDKRMSHTELAAELGTSVCYLGHIMHGRKSGKKYIYKIADVLGIYVEEFTA